LILSFGREGKAKEREREIQGSDLELEFEQQMVKERGENPINKSRPKKMFKIGKKKETKMVRCFYVT
jgi:hypothetical protein